MKESGIIHSKGNYDLLGAGKKILLSITLVGLLAVNATAGVFGIELGAQQTKLEAEFSYGNEYTKTPINLKDVGLDDSASTFKPTLFWQEGNHKFDFDYQSIGFSGSHKLTKLFTWGPVYYDLPGAEIETTLDIKVARLGYKYRLLRDNKSYLDLGADVNIVTTEINIAAPKHNIYANKVTAKQSLWGLVADGNYAFTDMFGIESKLAVGPKSQEAYAGLNMDLFKNAQFRVGYNYKRLKLDMDNGLFKKIDADFKFKGAFLGLIYRF